MSRAVRKFEVYQDVGGMWRWRTKAGNGRNQGNSSEGYTTRAKARTALMQVINDIRLERFEIVNLTTTEHE